LQYKHQPKAKKHFGQHFLKDVYYLHKIVQATSEVLKSSDAPESSEILESNKTLESTKLVEVGVGLGDLTEKLLDISSVIAYEVDCSLCSFVLQRFHQTHKKGRLTLINRDVLKIPFRSGWLCNDRYMLVSNLPYNIATRIVINMLKDPLCIGFVVMTQKEVALKFCASRKDRTFCALSVLAQSVGRIELLFDVERQAFEPMPNVSSSVFRLIKHKNPLKLDDSFEAFIKATFKNPRKTLYNNLVKICQTSNIKDIFKTLRLEANIRAHEISTKDYHQIYHTLLKDKQ